jgi:hypothetical protein
MNREEQLESIGKELWHFIKSTTDIPAIGAMALELTRPIHAEDMLAEPEELEMVGTDASWLTHLGVVRKFLANRRNARLCPKPKDAAVEVVKRIAVFNGANGIIIGDETASQIVDAVRAADAQKEQR